MKATKTTRSGFTLVELIVVIVILAILMSVAIPSLVEYVSKARQKAFMAEVSAVHTATITVVAEEWAKGTDFDRGTRHMTNLVYDKTWKTQVDEIRELSGLSASKYRFLNFDISKYGQILCLRVETNDRKNRAGYYDCTLSDGRTYDGVWVLESWNGAAVDGFKWSEPVGVK